MLPLTPRPRPIPLPEITDQPSCTSYEGLLSPVSPGYQLHPFLRPSSLFPKYILYDFGRPPSTIIFAGEYTPSALSMSATTPPVKQFRIMVPTTPPLPVVVCNDAGVTVSDIFNAIYDTLNAPITPSWDDLNLPLIVTSPPLLPVGPHSYEEHPSDTWPRLKAERKIDLLDGRSIFEGLEIGKLGAWESGMTRARHDHVYSTLIVRR